MDRMLEFVQIMIGTAIMAVITAAVWAYNHPNHIIAIAVVVGLALLFYDQRRIRKIPDNQGEEKEMASKRRQAQLDARWADKIHDFLFEDFVNDVIDRKTYKAELKRFGKLFNLPDLRTQSRNRNAVKYRILYATTSMKNAMKNVRAGAIPGPKPGEGVATVTVVPAQDFGSNFLKRRANVAVK